MWSDVQSGNGILNRKHKFSVKTVLIRYSQQIYLWRIHSRKYDIINIFNIISFSILLYTQTQTELTDHGDSDSFQRNNVMTACGPILENYNFPEAITVRCSKASCKLQCPIGQEPTPKFIKCNPKKKKFSPKAFSKVLNKHCFNCWQ